MPAHNVRLYPPLVRDIPHYPGQFGVAGSDVPLGERLSTTGKIIYVDPNYTGVTDDPDGTNPMCPVATITAALARCSDFAGDVILVAPSDAWSYGPNSGLAPTDTGRRNYILEDVVVTKHGVHIIGLGTSSGVGVIWRPATAGGTACLVRGLDVCIEGFAFRGSPADGGGGTGIAAEWDGITSWGDTCVVKNCWFGGNIDYGVRLIFAWNSYIEDCMFEAVANAAIYADPKESPPVSNTIRRNYFSECGLGALGAISMPESQSCLIADNWIFNSKAQSGVDVALEGIDTHGGINNIVCNNWESCLLANWSAFNGSAVTDAYIANHLMDGPTVSNP